MKKIFLWYRKVYSRYHCEILHFFRIVLVLRKAEDENCRSKLLPKAIFLITFTSFLMLGTAGCVRRIVTIDSEPPSAEVYLNRKLVGKTPCTCEFLYYGGHHLELFKEGYTNLNTTLKLKGPIYEYFPFSIFSELLIPWQIIDEHNYTFKLEKGQTKKPLISPFEQQQPPLPPVRLERIKENQE